MNESNGTPVRPETREEPRGPLRAGRSSRLLGGLSSGKLALTLILLLILLSLAGAMLPQEGQLAAADVAQWQVDHAIVTRIAAPLGLFHVFHSWPFLATILLLAVNTLTCTVLRFYAEDGVQAFKGPAAIERAGFVLLHLSLILLFAGGFWSAAADLRGKIILTKGQGFTDAHDQYLELQEGPLRRERHTGLVFRLQDVDIEYAKRRYPVAVTSKLAVLADGDQVATGVVEVNKPFEYQGLSFTQDETGFSPRLVIRDAARGGLLLDSFVALKTLRTAAGREYRDFLPLPFLKRRIVVTLYPSYTRENGQVRKAGDALDEPLLLVEAEDKSGQVAESHHLQVGGRVTIGQHSFAFADLRRWASFRVGHDPGYPLVCAALWLGLLALLMRYLPDLLHWLGEEAPPAPVPSGPPCLQRPLTIDAEGGMI
jgi:cytochrome c biogenesis protein ResB